MLMVRNEIICNIKSESLTKSIAHKQMSHVMRKPAFCICENKDVDELCGNRTADQHLSFRCIDSTITLLS